MSGTHLGPTVLAVLGPSLGGNVARHDATPATYDRTAGQTGRFMAEHGGEGPVPGPRPGAPTVVR